MINSCIKKRLNHLLLKTLSTNIKPYQPLTITPTHTRLHNQTQQVKVQPPTHSHLQNHVTTLRTGPLRKIIRHPQTL